MKKYLEFRNFSTILTTVLLSVFGLIIGYAASHGVNLPFTAEVATSICSGFILCVFSYLNAKHQNTLFDNETDTIYIPIDGLTDGQVEAINNYIENIMERNLKHNEQYNGEVDSTLNYKEGIEDET